MGLKLAAMAAGILAFASICLPGPAAADSRLGAGLSGLGQRVSPVEPVASFGYGRGYRQGSNRGYRSGLYRGYRPHRGYRGPRKPRFRGYERYGAPGSRERSSRAPRKSSHSSSRRSGSGAARRSLRSRPSYRRR